MVQLLKLGAIPLDGHARKGVEFPDAVEQCILAVDVYAAVSKRDCGCGRHLVLECGARASRHGVSSRIQVIHLKTRRQRHGTGQPASVGVAHHHALGPAQVRAVFVRGQRQSLRIAQFVHDEGQFLRVAVKQIPPEGCGQRGPFDAIRRHRPSHQQIGVIRDGPQVGEDAAQSRILRQGIAVRRPGRHSDQTLAGQGALFRPLVSRSGLRSFSVAQHRASGCRSAKHPLPVIAPSRDDTLRHPEANGRKNVAQHKVLARRLARRHPDTVAQRRQAGGRGDFERIPPRQQALHLELAVGVRDDAFRGRRDRDRLGKQRTHEQDRCSHQGVPFRVLDGTRNSAVVRGSARDCSQARDRQAAAQDDHQPPASRTERFHGIRLFLDPHASVACLTVYLHSVARSNPGSGASEARRSQRPPPQN